MGVEENGTRPDSFRNECTEAVMGKFRTLQDLEEEKMDDIRNKILQDLQSGRKCIKCKWSLPCGSICRCTNKNNSVDRVLLDDFCWRFEQND